jgi:hypothetical protein
MILTYAFIDGGDNIFKFLREVLLEVNPIFLRGYSDPGEKYCSLLD